MAGKITLSAAEAAFIGAKIASFAADAPQAHHWLIPFVQRHQAFPIYADMSGTIGLRPDGTLVHWSDEDQEEGVRHVDDPTWCTVALVAAARRYPALKGLAPARPVTAETCDPCKGSGTIHQVPCGNCGGVGWSDAR